MPKRNVLRVTGVAAPRAQALIACGRRANNLLAKLIEEDLGGECTVRNASISCKDAAGESEVALRDFIRRLARQGRPNREDARRHAQSAARSRVSKFEPCLPEALLCDLLAEMVVDEEGARRAVAVAVG